MISISNKSNPIITNSSLISNEIMRCLHQHRMLIYWKVTTIQPIPIQIGITIIIIDIRMPHQVRKVRINFFSTSYFNFSSCCVLMFLSYGWFYHDFFLAAIKGNIKYFRVHFGLMIDWWNFVPFSCSFWESNASHKAFATFFNENNKFYGNKNA